MRNNSPVKALEGWTVMRPKVRVNGMVRINACWNPLNKQYGGAHWVEQALAERKAVGQRLPPAVRWEHMTAEHLPADSYAALLHYMLDHGTRAVSPDLPMWYGEMRVVDLQYGVMNDIARSQGYRNFDHYHKWFLEEVLSENPERGMPKDAETIWPVILSTFADEGLQDGNHRFHQYVELGLETIPVLAFVTELQEIEHVVNAWLPKGT